MVETPAWRLKPECLDRKGFLFCVLSQVCHITRLRLKTCMTLQKNAKTYKTGYVVVSPEKICSSPETSAFPKTFAVPETKASP